MQKFFICGCVAIILAYSVQAQQQAHTSKPSASKKQPASETPQPDVNELLQGNIRAMWSAFKDKKKEAYSEYLWDDFQAVEEDGDGERNKLRVLREVNQSVVSDYSLQLFRVDPISAEAALVTYENVIKFPRGAGSRFEKIFVSEIWVKRHGQWKAWRYQATRVK